MTKLTENINVLFARALLLEARRDARAQKITVPKRITALKSSDGQWFVEARNVPGHYIKADNALEARAKYIYMLIDKGAAQ